MFNEHILCLRGAALHAIQHHNIRARFDRQRDVEVGPRTPDFNIDRLFPIGDLAQF